MTKHDKHVGFPEILINMDNRRIYTFYNNIHYFYF